MNDFSNDLQKCPHCNGFISQEIFNDHLLCHEIENEENNFGQANNINPIENNNNLNNERRNINQNNDQINNQNENILSKVFNMFSSPFQRANEHNSQMNLNNNNENNNNAGFFNSLIGRNPNNNDSQNNNRINNNNNNQQQNENNIIQSLTNTLSTGITNALYQIGNEMANITSNLAQNDIIRSTLLDNNPLRLIRNNRTNINNNNNIPRIGVPQGNIPPNNNNRIEVQQVNIQPNNNYLNPGVIVLPPIIVGQGGQINNYGNNIINDNRIKEEELNRIMELLPTSILREKKEGEIKECVICLGEFEVQDNITTLPCVHFFHKECIREWLETRSHCPVCKMEITLNSLLRDN